MAIDPSIILSGNRMAPVEMPDVNAMMQTRTAGLENMYKIEQQRKADAAAAAAAQKDQAAAQEAATVKALLPAYTYGIQTGDAKGLGNLVPPEMRERVQSYLDALTGKSPEEVKSALIGSLSSFGQTGQEALKAIQSAETTGIQREQNVLSRDRLNLDRQKAALDAQGQGEWKLEPGEGGFFWTNPRTREVERANVTGAAPGAAPGASGAAPAPGPSPIPSPDAVTPRQPALGAPEAAPISTQQPPAEFRPKSKDASEKPKDLKEQEAKSLDLAAQMTQANKITDELDAKGVRTSDAFVSFTEGLFAALPDAAGRNLAEQMRTVAENLLPSLSADEQRLARAQIQFVDAVLRSRSGAEIKTSEFPSMYRVFFPTEADENIPDIVADKKAARRLAVDTMRAKAGTLGAETLDRILRENGVLPSAATPLTPGVTLDGFEYLGD